MVMHKLFFLILYCCLQYPVAGQKNAYTRIDQYAAVTPDSATVTPAALSAHLTAIAKNDIEKCRAFYTWMALHIAYDDSLAAIPFIPNAGVPAMSRAALLRRKAICAGYAALFKELAEAAGIETVVIDGYARSSYTVPNSPVPTINHSWNAVKINGKWQLLDVTWGRNHADSAQPYYFYFLTPADQFVYTHFPKDTKWQLLNQTRTRDWFNRLPQHHAAFFYYGFEHLSVLKPPVTAEGKFSFSFSNKKNMSFSAYWQPDGDTARFQQKIELHIRRRKGSYRLSGSIPAGRTGILHIYAGEETYHAGMRQHITYFLDWLLSFRLNG
jgi:hypothetical protein